jgi:flagellar assembly protein FliH
LKLIKKRDQGGIQLEKLSFSDEPETFVAAAAVPAWMEQRPAPKRPGGHQAPLDPAQIEKAAYEDGFRQGEKAGWEIAEKKAEVIMKRYADTIQEMGRIKPTLYAQVEREVVKLALEVAKKIVHREVQVDKEIVQTLIKVALSHVAVKSAVTVHLHPTDYNFVLEQRTAAHRTEENDREIVLLADKSMDRGGCLIETECGDIDARIEEEFREVERTFFTGKD